MTCGTGMLPESLVDWVTGPGAVQVHFGPDLVPARSRTTRHLHLVIVRGNPGVNFLNPYPTLQKPLPLVRVRVFEGQGKGFEGYRGTRI